MTTREHHRVISPLRGKRTQPHRRELFQRARFLKEDDCLALASFMNSGFSFRQSLDLIGSRENKGCIAEMEAMAETGMKFNDILISHTRRPLGTYIQGFSSSMPLAESISAACEIMQNERQMKEKLIRELIYPLLLFCGVMAGILLFSHTVLPALLSVMQGFSGSSESIFHLRTIMHSLLLTLLISGGTLLFGSLFFLHPKRAAVTLQKIGSRFPSSLLNQYASILFVRYFLACASRNISTKESLKMIASLKDSPLPAFIASQLDSLLNHGENLDSAIHHIYIEEKLIRFFHIGMHCGDCCTVLKRYLQMSEQRAVKQVQIFSRTVQLISYGAVGFILIIVYRLLMTPLEILKTF